MAVKQHQVSIKIDAEDRSKRSFNSVRTSLANLRQSFGSANDVMQRMIGGMAEMKTGVSIITSMTGPAFVFEDAMKRAEVTSGATASEMAILSGEVERLAKQQKIYSKLDVANALKGLTEEGFNATESLQSLEKSLNLATVANTNTSDAAVLLKQALVAYNMEATDAGRTADILSSNFLETGTSISDQVSAVTYLGQTFAALNIPIEDSTALIAVLGDKGIKGTRAMSSFGSALGDMIEPGSNLNKLLMNAGVNVDGLALGTITLSDFTHQLGQAFDSGTLSARDLASQLEGRTANAFLAIAQNADYIDQTMVAAKNSMGSTEIAASKLTDTSAAGAKDIQKSFEDLRMEMGEQLVPAMIPMLDVLKRSMDLYSKLPGPVQELIPLLIASGAGIMIVHGAALLLAANPITLAILGVIAALYLMNKLMRDNNVTISDLLTPFEKLWGWINKVTDAGDRFANSAIGKMASGISGTFSTISGRIPSFHPISSPTRIEHTGVANVQRGEIILPGTSAAGGGKGLTGLGNQVPKITISIGSIRNDRDIRMIKQALTDFFRRKINSR